MQPELKCIESFAAFFFIVLVNENTFWYVNHN